MPESPLPNNSLTAISLPKSSTPKEEVLKTLESLKSGDVNWKGGKVFGLVYPGGEAYSHFLKEAYNLYFTENGLNPIAFASLKEMEHRTVRMMAHLFHNDNAVGAMTSGGTESILLAVKAARGRHQSRLIHRITPQARLGQPEVLAARTVHAAFPKACDYFGLQFVPIDTTPDQRMDVKKLRRRINGKTALIVASAPQYPHGVIDPIADIGELAKTHDIPFHVDACIGGMLLPFLKMLGEPIPPFDFEVPGVTSLSVDLHKYGYAAKGASVLLHRDMSTMKHQFFVDTDSPSGVYASQGILGTRAGGAIAAAYAALLFHGEEGYLQRAKETLAVREKLISGLLSIPEIELVGRSQSGIVAYTIKQPYSVFALADQIEKLGFYTDRQQYPDCIHCTLNVNHQKSIEAYIEAVRQAVDIVKENPKLKSSGNAAMYGMMAKIPARSLVKKAVLNMMQDMYGVEGRMPLSGNSAEDSGNNDPVKRFINAYGDVALHVLEKIDKIRKKRV